MDIKYTEENIYTDNTYIAAAMSKAVPTRSIKIEMDDPINEVPNEDKTNYTTYEPRLNKTITVKGIKLENDVNQVPNMAPNYVTIKHVKVEELEGNNNTLDRGTTVCNEMYKTAFQNIPKIKVETLDVAYERIGIPENDNEMTEVLLRKVQGVKVENVDNQELSTRDTSYRCEVLKAEVPKFVGVQTVKVERDDINQGIDGNQTSYTTLTVSGTPDANGDSNSIDTVREGALTDDDSSSAEPTNTRQRGKMRPRGAKKETKNAQAKQTNEKPQNKQKFDNKVSCMLCPFETNNEKHLSYHLKAHAAEVSYKCDLCSYMTINKYHLTFHYKVHSSEKSYSCSVCDKTFNSKGDLNRHFRIHSGEKPFVCDICNKTFTDGTALRNHLRWHSGKKPFSCDICNRTFTQRGTLTSHLKTHSGKKPYTCEICNKPYGYRVSLRNHMRVHTGEVLYSCEICNKAYNSKGTLKSHYLLHTDEKPYSCKYCSKTFKLSTLLRKHLRRVHSGEPDALNIINSLTRIKALPDQLPTG